MCVSQARDRGGYSSLSRACITSCQGKRRWEENARRGYTREVRVEKVDITFKILECWTKFRGNTGEGV